MKRFSKKRQSIIDLVKSTKVHPDAEWIYFKLKPIYPDLSIATVYRNLGELTAQGIIKPVGTVCGKERFDGTTTPHAHAVCVKCGKIIDLPETAVPDEMLIETEKATGFTINYSDIKFVGLCDECKKEK